MGTIIWNQISSRSIPLVVERPPDYVVAERDYDVVHVLGRNGDLLTDSGSYKNVEQPYDIAFGSLEKTHSEMASAVSEWLHSAHGYARLEDSYDPDHYRMAYYVEETELENILDHLGRATINFNCMPQRFLKSGEKKIIFTDNESILMNPTNFNALPDITVFGQGSAILTVNGLQIKISDTSDGVTLDSSVREAYATVPDGTIISRNYMVEWPDNPYHPFPSFSYKKNVISFSGNVDRVEVIPRWWTL